MAKDDPKKKPDPGSNIPTVLGVPAIPDPRLEPKVEAKPDAKPEAKPAAKPQTKPQTKTEPLKPIKPPPPKKESEPDILEIEDVKPEPKKPASLPPPTEPRVSEPDAPFEPALGTARPNPVELAKAKWKELREGPRPRFIAFVSIGGLVVLIFFGVLLRLAFGTKSSDDTGPVASASASASASALASAPPPVASDVPSVATTQAAPPKDVACALGSSTHVVSPRAVVNLGIDVAGTDAAITVAFSAAANQRSLATLDVASAAMTKMAKAPSAPSGFRTVGDWDVGGKNGELVWGKHGSADTKTLWKLETDGAVEALRGAPTSDGAVVAYRHAGAIWIGKASDTASTPFKIPGLGPQVGSPAIAKSGDHVLVAWADRSDAAQPWGLRIAAWTPGSDPKPAQSFTVPEGGPGSNAMAPSISALANGFLLLWTEGAMGPTDKQQVRAQVLRVDGTSSGSAIRISPDGVHAGQGQAAFLADGRGIVAFLADAGKAFELRATTMKCE